MTAHFADPSPEFIDETNFRFFGSIIFVLEVLNNVKTILKPKVDHYDVLIGRINIILLRFDASKIDGNEAIRVLHREQSSLLKEEAIMYFIVMFLDLFSYCKCRMDEPEWTSKSKSNMFYLPDKIRYPGIEKDPVTREACWGNVAAIVRHVLHWAKTDVFFPGSEETAYYGFLTYNDIVSKFETALNYTHPNELLDSLFPRDPNGCSESCYERKRRQREQQREEQQNRLLNEEFMCLEID